MPKDRSTKSLHCSMRSVRSCAMGTNLDFPNLPRLILITPLDKSTSSRFKDNASPTLIPVK